MSKYFFVFFLPVYSLAQSANPIENTKQYEVLAWTPAMQLKVKTPATPRVSPDGKRMVYTISTPVMTADKSEYSSQIWVSSADDKEASQLTTGEKPATNPKWSPDGQAIAFTSTRNNNRNNIFLLPLSGREARALTDLKGNILNFEFSPDGSVIAFTMMDPKSEEEEKNDRGKNDFRWVDENIKQSRLYLIHLNKDTVKPEPIKLVSENYSVTNFDWSPDGSLIVFGHVQRPGQNYTPTSDISIVDTQTGKIRLLAGTTLPELLPTFSPDGKTIAFISGLHPELSMTNEFTIQTIPVSGGVPKSSAVSLDGRTTIFPGWAADGKYYFTEARSTGTNLFAINFTTGKVDEKKLSGVSTAISLNQDGKYFGWVGQKTDSAPEVYYSLVSDFKPVTLTRMNADYNHIPLGKTETIHWKSGDGKLIEGLITYPPGYLPGKKVPLILNIHGGPNGIFQQTFLGNPDEYPLASLSAEGFAILRPNPRGSTGYGTGFRLANIRDFGGGDYQDLMAGVDKVIQMGVADPEKLGVMGWSYGGYVTAWVITHTKRFKAASAGAAPVNLMSAVGVMDFPLLVSQYLKAEYWEDPAIYQKTSPLFHINGVTTPTLIQHGEADVRVPISQGYEFYYALIKQGVPVRMIVLPRQPHGPTEPKLILAAMEANMDWFRKYLGGSSK